MGSILITYWRKFLVDDENSMQYGKEWPFASRRYSFNFISNLSKKAINKKNDFVNSYYRLAERFYLCKNFFNLDFFIFTIKRG
jgi:hypothetical protein